jgi:hypothetical protein
MRIRYRGSSRIVPTQARKVMMAAAVIGGCGLTAACSSGVSTVSTESPSSSQSAATSRSGGQSLASLHGVCIIKVTGIDSSGQTMYEYQVFYTDDPGPAFGNKNPCDGSDLLAGMSYVNSVPAGYFKACSDAGETADGGTAAPYASEWLTSTADEEGSCRDGGVVVTS